MATIGENIQRLREENGWSKTELAEKIGKSRAAISQYESGKNTPRMGVIEDLADVFHVKKSDIIESHITYACIKLDDPPLNDDERELVSLYRSLPSRGRHAVLVGLRDFAGRS